MSRSIWHGCAALVVCLLGVGQVHGAPPTADSLLSAATKSYFSLPNFPASLGRWEKTGFGKLFADPAVKPFQDDLARQLREADRTKLRLALTLDDIRAMAGGEVAWGLVHAADTTPAQFLLVDVTGKADAAQTLLKSTAEKFVAGGYQSTSAEVAGVTLTVLAAPSADAVKDKTLRTNKVWFVSKDLLCIAESQPLAEQLAKSITGSPPADPLSQHAAFQAVMQRSTKDAAGATVDLRWYVDPFGLLTAERLVDPRLKPKKKPDSLEVYRKEGFTAIQAVGGCVQLGGDDAEVVHRTMIYAPSPYQRAMRMLKLPNVKSAELAPPAWVADRVASCIVAQIDVLNAFDHYGTLFDTLYGEGDEGLWADLIDGWAKDPKGPKVNVRDDIVAQFTNRMVQVSESRTPVSADNARTVSSVEIKPGASIEKPIDRLLDGEPTVKVTELSGKRAYAVYQDERQKPPPASIMAVVGSQIYSASHADALESFLAGTPSGTALTADPAFQAIQQAAAKHGLAEACLFIFSNSARQLQTPYELFRTGKLHEVEDSSLAGTLLKRIVPTEAKDDAPAVQSLDGSKLPAFEAVQKFLGPSGTWGASEEQGWYLQGVLLAPRP
ncbi:MAG: hypothetical protein JNM18_10855 [Planctomycetaceae bacterium]|nr:hypothetical protein [Planctomycetaceae bacterium]